MNRIIKFRGMHRHVPGRWVYGDLRQNGPDDVDIMFQDGTGDGAPVKPETVSQFTGIVDPNGAEVYENHLCQAVFGTNGQGTKSRREKTFICPVVFSVNHGWQIATYSAGIRTGDYRWYPDRGTWIVVGNTFENPELLPK